MKKVLCALFVKRRVFAFAIAVAVFWIGFGETVENVRGQQQENSKLVDIYYDLNDTDGGTYFVVVEVVGSASDVSTSSFSGDVGDGISPGQNLHVIWDAGADWPNENGYVKAIVTVTKKDNRDKVQLWEGGPYWATTNIGADNPWENGLYFWWGDTIGHRPSSDETFSFDFYYENPAIYTNGKSLSELQNAGWVTSDGVLTPSHDAAHVQWGGAWRMPTDQELKDLCRNKCDWTWKNINGAVGYIVRGRGDYALQSIFLPVSGYGYRTSLGGVGSVGVYWASDMYVNSTDSSKDLYFNYSTPQVNVVWRSYNGRADGQTIRPVQGGTSAPLVESVAESSDWFAVDTTDKPLTLVVESADWSSGSITLCCTDADNSGIEHKYYLSYYEAIGEAMGPGKNWYDIIGATEIKADREVGPDGKNIWIAHLSDRRFAKRNMGFGTVKYRVCDENGRMAECETRNRHGLFVAVDKYQNGWAEAHANHKNQVEAFRNAYISYGGANGYLPPVMNGSKATWENITDELDYMAESKVNPGDIALFYYVGHGANGGLTCYDYKAYISASDLSKRLCKFPSSVGVVALIDSCHSASMIDTTGIGNGMGNIAWIVASQADESTYCGAFQSVIYHRGWVNGGADHHYASGDGGNGDGYVTFGELALWGQQLSGKTYYKYWTLTSFWNSLVLDNIVAGRVPAHSSVVALDEGPSVLTASPGNAGEINLEWSSVAGATGYDIYWRTTKPAMYGWRYDDTVKDSHYVVGRSYALAPNAEYEYYVRAVNSVYVSDASPTISCAPYENTQLRDCIVSCFMSLSGASSFELSEHPPIVNGEVNYSNLNYDHDNDGFTTFEEYVAGTDPANGNSTFVGKISVTNNVPFVTWSPDLGDVRKYTVYGKTELGDLEWVLPTNATHRFFKVMVEMP